MAKAKYERHFYRGPFFFDRGGMPGGYPGWSINAANDDYKAGLCMTYQCIADTAYTHAEPHYHDWHELLCFFGGNISDIADFGAEVHFCMGEELEEHVITSPTVISIPPGLIHSPLTIKKITKPIAFMMLAAGIKEYPGVVHNVKLPKAPGGK
jgi:uncharacterized RmlC-like cupin family protein